MLGRAAALFIDVKRAFDYVSNTRMVERMIELGIDGDIIRWTQSFLTDQGVQLVIDGHDNKGRDVEKGIPQGSLVSPIHFLIYISGVFDKIAESNPSATSLYFVDDFGFVASGYSVTKLTKTLGEVAKVVLNWGKCNSIKYDMAKMEAVLFSKLYRQD